jgi:hypothetical protein
MSLHRAASSRVASTRDGSPGVLRGGRIGAWHGPFQGHRRHGPSSAPTEWRWWFRARRSGRSMLAGGLLARPFKALPPERIGTGCPAPALLWSAARRSSADVRPRSRASFPVRSSARSGGSGGCFPRVPLWGSLLRRPGAPVCSPGAILLRAFDAVRPTTRRTRHLGVLRTAESAGRLRLPTPLSFATDWRSLRSLTLNSEFSKRETELSVSTSSPPELWDVPSASADLPVPQHSSHSFGSRIGPSSVARGSDARGTADMDLSASAPRRAPRRLPRHSWFLDERSREAPRPRTSQLGIAPPHGGLRAGPSADGPRHRCGIAVPRDVVSQSMS